jgi:hypothetical protein
VSTLSRTATARSITPRSFVRSGMMVMRPLNASRSHAALPAHANEAEFDAPQTWGCSEQVVGHVALIFTNSVAGAQFDFVCIGMQRSVTSSAPRPSSKPRKEGRQTRDAAGCIIGAGRKSRNGNQTVGLGSSKK